MAASFFPFVVFDLEYTTWEGAMARGWSGPGEHRELVQIGAVKVEEGWRLGETFSQVVKPVINPILSDYFVRLTGISQAEVDRDGLPLAAALAGFHAFAGPDIPLISNGNDGGVVAENCGLLACIDPLVGRYASIREFINQHAGQGRSVASSELPQALGFSLPGRAHQGLADALAIATALRLLQERGVPVEAELAAEVLAQRMGKIAA